MARRGGSDDEFRCPVCHYMFPIAQRDHVQRCVRREMAQDPRIQRRIRSETLQKTRASRSETSPAAPNKPAGGGGGGGGGGPVPSLSLKAPPTKGAPKARPKSMAVPPNPKTTSSKGKPTPASSAPPPASINIGQGGLVISHQATKSRSATTVGTTTKDHHASENHKTTPAPTTTTPAPTTTTTPAPATTTTPAPAAASLVASQSVPVVVTTNSKPTVTKSGSIGAITLKTSGGSSSKSKSSKESKKKDSKSDSKDNKDKDNKDKKSKDKLVKASTPREFATAVATADEEKMPARVYSGMKQNSGTFWTFVISKSTTAVDLMDLVSAKCGIPVEVMALYSATPANIETRIKDDENVHSIKKQWQKVESQNRFVLKDRIPGDLLVRKSTLAVPAHAPPSAPPPPPAGYKPKPAEQQSPLEQQEVEEANENGEGELEDDGEDQYLCPVFSGLDSLPLDTRWNFLVGPTVVIADLLVFIAATKLQELQSPLLPHNIAAFEATKMTVKRIPDTENISKLMMSWQGRHVRLVVKPRPPSEDGTAIPGNLSDSIDHTQLNIEEMDEEALLAEQWECKKEQLVTTLSQFLERRPTPQQLAEKKIIVA